MVVVKIGNFRKYDVILRGEYAGKIRYTNDFTNRSRTHTRLMEMALRMKVGTIFHHPRFSTEAQTAVNELRHSYLGYSLDVFWVVSVFSRYFLSWFQHRFRRNDILVVFSESIR